jgi:hypothetical protein
MLQDNDLDTEGRFSDNVLYTEGKKHFPEKNKKNNIFFQKTNIFFQPKFWKKISKKTIFLHFFGTPEKKIQTDSDIIQKVDYY